MELMSLAYDIYEREDTNREACPILLMHGLFWNKYELREVAEDLCKATKRKVIAIDLRNHGESPSSEECDILLMLEDIKKFLRDHNLKKVSFVSHSFSSTITYLFALENPEAVEKMVMIDHPPFSDRNISNFKNNVLPQFTAQNRYLKTLDPTMSLEQAKKKILKLADMGTKGQKYFLRKVANDLRKENGKFKWAIDTEFLIERYREGAFQIEPRGSLMHEILFVRCKNSERLTDKMFEAVLKHNPNVRLETLDDTTHLLMLEEREEFINKVK